MSRLKRAMDPLIWAWCWIAFHALGPLPIFSHRKPGLAIWGKWLLPYAGFYAYYEPDLHEDWRWSERRRP